MRFLLFALWIACDLLLNCTAAFAAQQGEAKDLSIVQQWNGDYPVSALNRLPEIQRKSRVGYLGDAAIFNDVWQAFKPGKKVPEVDFSIHLVLFCRNVEFYNRTSIAKVTVMDGVAEVITIETLSAIPIEDKVAIALAVIPREGVKFIQAGEERTPVTVKESTDDPMNCTYIIERQRVRLVNGRSEVNAAPGSATEIETWVLGKPVYSDLDGKGQDDVALLLVWNLGGGGHPMIFGERRLDCEYRFDCERSYGDLSPAILPPFRRQAQARPCPRFKFEPAISCSVPGKTAYSSGLLIFMVNASP